MFDALGLAVKDLGTLDSNCLSDDELADALVELSRHRDALEATQARLTRAFDVRTVYAADGAKSAAAWLARRRGRPRKSAGRRCGWDGRWRRCR